MALAIIPARGGSKGIPGKNIIPVCDKPLLAWTIEQSVADGMTPLVATDDTEISNVATQYGGEVWWRSAETATDTATTESVLCEIIETRVDIQPDEPIVLLQATSPIRQPGDIQQTISMLDDYDSVFAGRHIEGYTWTRHGGHVRSQYEKRRPRQQETITTIEETGAIYACRAAGLLRTGNRLHGKIGVYMTHPLDGYQIDVWSDISVIESLIPLRIPWQCQ